LVIKTHCVIPDFPSFSLTITFLAIPVTLCPLIVAPPLVIGIGLVASASACVQHNIGSTGYSAAALRFLNRVRFSPHMQLHQQKTIFRQLTVIGVLIQAEHWHFLY
jgi:hypothetical protein